MQMDAVDRYEGRTLWGQGKELQTKFASTKVSLRARPPGFGLQVPHSVHRVLSACGIKDASADINGSTHKVNVMKAVIQLLHGGVSFIMIPQPSSLLHNLPRHIFHVTC